MLLTDETSLCSPMGLLQLHLCISDAQRTAWSLQAGWSTLLKALNHSFLVTNVQASGSGAPASRGGSKAGGAAAQPHEPVAKAQHSLV
jgi:hypothetical protein